MYSPDMNSARIRFVSCKAWSRYLADLAEQVESLRSLLLDPSTRAVMNLDLHEAVLRELNRATHRYHRARRRAPYGTTIPPV